jgi:hypothetical protein
MSRYQTKNPTPSYSEIEITTILRKTKEAKSKIENTQNQVEKYTIVENYYKEVVHPYNMGLCSLSQISVLLAANPNATHNDLNYYYHKTK